MSSFLGVCIVLFFIVGLVAIIAVIINFSELVNWYYKQKEECVHDFDKWSEPTTGTYPMQIRVCKKCNMIQKREVR